jgi:hypothetical protein
LNNTRGLGIAAGEQLVELFLRDFARRLVAEWVMIEVAQRLSPIFDKLAERALAGAIANEALIIL